MPTPHLTAEEIGRRGESIYQRDLRSRVEPGEVGKFLVLDLETGDYEIDADEVAALDRAMAKHPRGMRYLVRIGDPSAYHFGGRLAASGA